MMLLLMMKMTDDNYSMATMTAMIGIATMKMTVMVVLMTMMIMI